MAVTDIHTYLLSLKPCSMTMTPLNNTYSFSRSPVIVSPVPPSENVFQDQSSQSEENEWEVESGMQSEHPEDPDQVEVNHASNAENGPTGSAADKSSDSDWSDTERCRLKHEQTTREILAGNYDIDTHPSTPLEFPTSSEDTTDTKDADQYM
ncbi:hypothetical protein EV401DRAFT_1890987 [Pisolithus croceorrhizus]|nr:hypothetical protein EV401DRAFT_1890987 [Pisolithus croceorrhizus]